MKNKWNEVKKQPKPLDEKDTAFLGMTKLSPEEKTRRIKAHFQKVATRYDRMNTILSFGLHRDWKRRTIELANISSGDVVLDVCAGTGDLAILAGRRTGEKGCVILCDFSKEMLVAGRKKYHLQEEKGHVLPVSGDAMALPMPNDSVDVIITGFGMRNVNSMPVVFSEMVRVLKPGGKMVCLEFSKPPNQIWRFLYDFYSFHIMPRVANKLAGNKDSYEYLIESIRQFPPPAEIAETMKEAGFAEVTWKPFTGGIAVAHVACKK